MKVNCETGVEDCFSKRQLRRDEGNFGSENPPVKKESVLPVISSH